jgi:hypothetical protein
MKNFLKYIFNFDKDTRIELINMLQFALIGFIPLIILMKVLEKYNPNPDNIKNSIEISGEIVIHIIFLLLGLFFIVRIVTYFPPISGEEYPKISIIIFHYRTGT